MNRENRDKQALEKIIRYCGEIGDAKLYFGNDPEKFAATVVFKNACAMSLLQIGELAGAFAVHKIGDLKHRGSLFRFCDVGTTIFWAEIP